MQPVIVPAITNSSYSMTFLPVWVFPANLGTRPIVIKTVKTPPAARKPALKLIIPKNVFPHIFFFLSKVVLVFASLLFLCKIEYNHNRNKKLKRGFQKMSVKNAGAVIKEARLKANLTQEKLSEGVCSLLSLSRIENGSAGVSPVTFQALMTHAGAECKAFPSFASRTDFICFYSLKRARFYLDSWQLSEAHQELTDVESKNWSCNKFYYQEWLLLYSMLLIRSGCKEHCSIQNTLLYAFHISRPDSDVTLFHHLLLSVTEIELLILLAQEYLALKEETVCGSICKELSVYLNASLLPASEKNILSAEYAVVYTKYLLFTGDYTAALQIEEDARKQMIDDVESGSLHELTFLASLCHHFLGNAEEASTLFKTAFYSAHSIGSCYATICRNYIKENRLFALPEKITQFPDIPLFTFALHIPIDVSAFDDGTYEINSPETLSFGGLIRELRMEQKLSQQALCQGLCSKSKLSKIENDTLQPNIALAQTLLQRLGLSDHVFTFFGSKREEKLQELKLRMAHTRVYQCDLIQNYVRNMQNLCSEKDKLYLQYALFKNAVCEPKPASKIELLQEALKITCPNFSFNLLYHFRFSWNELTILNCLCSAYADLTPSKGILYCYKLLEYLDNVPIDILEKRRILPITVMNLVYYLYVQKRFTEILELSEMFLSPILKNATFFIGNIYSHYGQALAECTNLSLSYKFVHYAYYDFLLIMSFKNAARLQTDIFEDFQITLI